MAIPAVVDFETEEIDDQPHYPPKPVGVAIKLPGRVARYYAFGHSEGNNCSQTEAVNALREAVEVPNGVLCHNIKFDADVSQTHMGVDFPPPERCHDTMVLGYLDDPHSRRLALKELGPAKLGREPVERDALRDWIITNVAEAKKKKSQWGAFISRAPGHVVAPYAKADTEFPLELWKVLHPSIMKAGMVEAYQREMQIIPVLLRNEHEGITVDVPLLAADVERYERELERADAWVRKKLKVSDLDVDSDTQLADAIEAAGLVSADGWVLTEKGSRSTSKENLIIALGSGLLVAVLTYRNTLATCLRTFMRKWLAMALETGGRIHTVWNSTAQAEGGGTRTGRFSSTPNFQNIPSDDKLAKAESLMLNYGLNFLPLPRVRRYIVADKTSMVICARDFSQQEPRLLSHFEDDLLAEAYVANPRMDIYMMMVREVREQTGLLEQSDGLARTMMKTLVLAILYGLGLGSLAERLGCSVDEARKLKRVLFTTFPGIKDLIDDLNLRGKSGVPMRTWGGRLYYAEPPRLVKGVFREFNYKLINYLIQGSAADQTKEAMLRYDRMRKHGRFMLSVHDELLICAPKKAWKSEMRLLKEAMEDMPGIDVPMVSDGEVGYRWFEMEKAA